MASATLLAALLDCALVLLSDLSRRLSSSSLSCVVPIDAVLDEGFIAVVVAAMVVVDDEAEVIGECDGVAGGNEGRAVGLVDGGML